MCAKTQCSEFVLVIYKNNKCSINCSMGSGLGHQGKLKGLCVGSFNNCFGKFVPFFNGPGKKAKFVYMSPAIFIYKITKIARAFLYIG